MHWDPHFLLYVFNTSHDYRRSFYKAKTDKWCYIKQEDPILWGESVKTNLKSERKHLLNLKVKRYSYSENTGNSKNSATQNKSWKIMTQIHSLNACLREKTSYKDTFNLNKIYNQPRFPLIQAWVKTMWLNTQLKRFSL